jgi:O-antigen/teichoic acid export membrane protein
MTEGVPRVLGTALMVQAVFGMSAGLGIAAVTPMLVNDVLALPAGLKPEGVSTLQLVALAIPIVFASNSLRGALYAAQRFDLVNAVLIPASSSLYVISAVGAVTGWTLQVIVAWLVASKVVALAMLGLLAWRHCPGLAGRRPSLSPTALAALLRFGSWATVSSVTISLVSHVERLLIPVFLSVGMLTYYSVPYEAVSRGAIVPVSMALALFPVFSRFNGREGQPLTSLVVRPLKYLLLIMTPALTFVVLFARELLSFWMGPSFAARAAAPLQFLAVAFYMGAFSHILRSAVHGLGRPDLKAQLDLLNGILFVTLLFTLIPRFGLVGAGGARAMTALTELVGLVILVSRIAPHSLEPGRLWHALSPGLAVGGGFVCIAAAIALMRGSTLAYAVFAVLTFLYIPLFWRRASDSSDREAVAHLRTWLER